MAIAEIVSAMKNPGPFSILLLTGLLTVANNKSAPTIIAKPPALKSI